MCIFDHHALLLLELGGSMLDQKLPNQTLPSIIR